VAKPKNSLENFKIFIFLLITLLVFILGRVEATTFLRDPISFIFQPVAYTSTKWAGAISTWSNALVNASKYIEQYQVCKDEILESRGTQEYTNLVLQENEILKKQLKLSNIENEYAIGTVMKYLSEGTIVIDVGTEDGVSKDDVVTFGNVFIGTVITVDLNSSIVKLPVNKASNLEVAIYPSTIDEGEPLKQDEVIKSSGVVSGGIEGIKIGNININSGVADGDLVVVRDERIGELLILGRVVGLQSNPASTSSLGFISPIYDYTNLINVFVKTN
jgi:cell shape-determining protein MreC